MKKIMVLCCLFLLLADVALAETIQFQPQEPALYDHLAVMQQTQERLSKRSPEEQERLQSKVREAELQACPTHSGPADGGAEDQHRRQGGENFVAYVLQFEKYCETLR